MRQVTEFLDTTKLQNLDQYSAMLPATRTTLHVTNSAMHAGKGDTQHLSCQYQTLHFCLWQADAFEAEQWRDQLQGAVGVVTCLGGFGSNEFMLKVQSATYLVVSQRQLTSGHMWPHSWHE